MIFTNFLSNGGKAVKFKKERSFGTVNNAQLVLANYYSALGSEKIDKVIETVHDEAKFIILKKEPSEKIPLYGTYEGKEGVKKYLSILSEAYQIDMFVINKIIGDQDTAFAWGSFRIKVRVTGKTFESDWAVVCEVEKEKIKLFQFFEDTAALEEAFDLT